mmetsp:Transcript_5370/g.13997  ORF Transcript_5370/g.13997 Transcript_5370/m.13997 type:complete len:164 (+) Transcript_5370:657-1148(+)
MTLIEAQLTNINPALLWLGRIVAVLVLYWHWTACLWYSVHSFDVEINFEVGAPLLMDLNSLGEVRDQAALSPRSRFLLPYSFCYFWAVTSISGGSPIHFDPNDVLEAELNWVVALIGVFATASVIGSASSALCNMEASTAQARGRYWRDCRRMRQWRPWIMSI